MPRVKNQSGLGLVEGLLILVIIAAVVAGGLYVKNHRTTNPSNAASQTTTAVTDYKKIATDPAKQGTITGIEAATSGNINDESQAEQQAENSQSVAANSDHGDGNNLGGTINENLINF